jgi:uncharacterized protein YcfJ
MNKAVLASAIGVLASAAGVAGAQEITGRVVSSTPVVQQVAVPRQVCGPAPVARSSGGGAVVGAIVGGLLGNTIGHGGGRAAATGLGVVAGAGIGDSVERNGQPYGQQCSTQTTYENRTVAYNVVYEYNGQQNTVQMPYDPGSSVRLQMSPVGSNAPVAAAPSGPAGAQPVVTAPPVGAPVGQIVSPQPAYTTTYVAPSAVVYPETYAYAAPAPYYYGYAPSYYYPPVSLSLGFGFSRGWGGHWGGHHHWR